MFKFQILILWKYGAKYAEELRKCIKLKIGCFAINVGLEKIKCIISRD